MDSFLDDLTKTKRKYEHIRIPKLLYNKLRDLMIELKKDRLYDVIQYLYDYYMNDRLYWTEVKKLNEYLSQLLNGEKSKKHKKL